MTSINRMECGVLSKRSEAEYAKSAGLRDLFSHANEAISTKRAMVFATLAFGADETRFGALEPR
jgi:hypothetical protein